MRLNEFSKATGASERQIDYWVRAGMPLAKPQDHTGSGVWREYYPEAIPKVRTVLLMSNKFGQYFSVDTLIDVFNNYELGYLSFGDGIIVQWRVDDRTYGASERGSSISR